MGTEIPLANHAADYTQHCHRGDCPALPQGWLRQCCKLTLEKDVGWKIFELNLKTGRNFDDCTFIYSTHTIKMHIYHSLYALTLWGYTSTTVYALTLWGYTSTTVYALMLWGYTSTTVYALTLWGYTSTTVYALTLWGCTSTTVYALTLWRYTSTTVYALTLWGYTSTTVYALTLWGSIHVYHSLCTDTIKIHIHHSPWHWYHEKYTSTTEWCYWHVMSERCLPQSMHWHQVQYTHLPQFMLWHYQDHIRHTTCVCTDTMCDSTSTSV